MKPRAVIVGANSAIARAMAERWRGDYELIGLGRASAGPGALSEYWQSDYSEASLKRIARELGDAPVSLLVCTVGLLHGDGQMPEKKLAELDPEQLSRYFTVNSIIPALVLKTFVPLMPKSEPGRIAILSAKIAGISDNRLGGWYGYRASKAALNMLIKTAAIELGRSHRKTALIALHPGTTDTPLSAPFSEKLPADKVFTPALTAERLCAVIDGLTPEDSGRFVHWDGSDLPW